MTDDALTAALTTKDDDGKDVDNYAAYKKAVDTIAAIDKANSEKNNTNNNQNTTTAPAKDPYIVCEACGYHFWEPYMGGYRCTHCGHLRGTTGVASTSSVSTIPQTSDSFPLVAVSALAVTSLVGMGFVAYKKKREDKE